MTTATAEALVRAVEQLAGARTLDRITSIVTGAMREVVGCDGATFVLREDDRCHYADEHAIAPLWKGGRFPMSACISGWAMLHREVVVVPDIYLDDRIPHDAYRPTFVASLAMAPIRRSEPLGALGAYWKDEHHASPEEVRLLETIADSAAVALENLELRLTVERRVGERDALAERASELGAAIPTIAHDLRSPLSAVMGFAELILETTDEPDWRSSRAAVNIPVFARSVLESGRRMSEQIETMLSLYRITHRAIEPVAVDLTALAHRVADQMILQADGRVIEVVIDDELRVTADPVLARLLLENLIGNAVKYTGARPVARVDVAHAGRVGDLASFVVRDNGAGFAPEDVDRLFRPMSRLHTDEEFPGTGLGLASVARIVDLHGGQVRAEGETGVGASFYVSLPAA